MAAAGYLAALAYFGLLWISDTEYLMMVFIGFLMTCMTIYVVTFPKYKTEEVTGAVFGLLYVPVMLSYLYLTRQMPDGSYVVWLIFISSGKLAILLLRGNALWKAPPGAGTQSEKVHRRGR